MVLEWSHILLILGNTRQVFIYPVDVIVDKGILISLLYFEFSQVKI